MPAIGLVLLALLCAPAAAAPPPAPKLPEPSYRSVSQEVLIPMGATYMDPCTHKGCGPPFAPFTGLALGLLVALVAAMLGAGALMRSRG